MPFAVAGPVLGAVAGGVTSSLLSPGTSGGSGGGGGPSYYIPTGLGTADTDWQSLLSQQLGDYAGFSQLPSLYQRSLDNTLGTISGYGANYQSNANNAAAQYIDLSNLLNQQSNLNFGTQQQLLGAGQGLLGAGQNVYNLALDPQNALYDRTLNQLTQQTGATNSMYGLGSSAAGAGVQNQALSNFNIDWQNNQLSRALQGLQGYAQGLQGYTGAANTAGSYGQLGTSQASAAPGYTLTAGQVPYQAGMALAGAPGQAASAYASGMETGPLSAASSIQDSIIPYLFNGIGAQAVPYQNQASGAGTLGALVSQGISGLGSNSQVQSTLGNAFSNYFNPASGSFSGGNFNGAFTYDPYYSGGGNSYGFTMQ